MPVKGISMRKIREVLRGLLRPHSTHCPATHGRDPNGSGVCRGAGGVQLHLCRGDLEPELAGLVAEPHAHFRVLRGRSRDGSCGLCCPRRYVVVATLTLSSVMFHVQTAT